MFCNYGTLLGTYGVKLTVLHTELEQYCFMSSFMAISFLCSFGPVWYHPTIRSLARIERNKTMSLDMRSCSLTMTWQKCNKSYDIDSLCVRNLTIHFLEHAIHILQVVVIQEPNWIILVILIKRHCHTIQILLQLYVTLSVKSRLKSQNLIMR